MGVFLQNRLECYKDRAYTLCCYHGRPPTGLDSGIKKCDYSSTVPGYIIKHVKITYLVLLLQYVFGIGDAIWDMGSINQLVS